MIHLFLQKLKMKILSDTRLNNDLNKISKWTFQWKMLFNPDLSKEAIEMGFFFINARTKIYPSLLFNDNKV